MKRLAALLLVLVSGCAAYQVVESGAASVGSLQIRTTSDWTSINPALLSPRGPDAVWTRDGTRLNYLFFYDGVGHGGALFETRGSNAEPFPSFRSTMTESEVSELVADSVKRFAGANEVVLVELAPTTFAGHRGFAAEFAYTGKSELDYRTYAVGAVIDEKLYLIIYNAPRLHYFEKDLNQVRRIVASAKITGT